jgi:hypothetical protein
MSVQLLIICLWHLRYLALAFALLETSLLAFQLWNGRRKNTSALSERRESSSTDGEKTEFAEFLKGWALKNEKV